MRWSEGEYAIYQRQRGLEVPESALLARVRQFAKGRGWLCYHTHRSDRSEQGFPDLVLVKPGRLIFAELKTRTGKLTPYQQVWLDLLARSVPQVEAYLWRPADWERITQILGGEHATAL